tara:strand:- start:2401 stop:2823 length:423 start_codon:yes stop_codon:yes gene_type:complete
MKRLWPLLLFIGSPAYGVPVVPNFSAGTMQSTTRTTSVVTESIVSHDYSGYQYSLNGSNISVDGNSIAPDPTTTTGTVGGQTQTWTGLDINSRGNVTITNPGASFQFVETYRGPSLQNVTNIQRTTNIESVTETTSVFSQ